MTAIEVPRHLCGRPRGAAEVNAMAKELGVTVPDLLVLHRTNDPFMTGTDADWKRARWFRSLWDRFGYTSGVHVRRMHYQTLSVGARLVTGEPYENTERCWSEILKASAVARALGLVDPSAFVDRKNALPVLNAGTARPTAFEPWLEWEPAYFRLPEIEASIRYPLLDLGTMRPQGYDYDDGDQPALVEVWVEKSTMNDALEPICTQMGVNLVVSSGFQSITNAVGLLQRAEQFHRPARIFYISDFDPAGDAMPVALSRQVEFWQTKFAPGADVKITPLAMTAELVDRFDLPRVPIKENDLRRKGFEARRGEGCVELDALEALHPGVLARLVREAVEPYRDPNLEDRLRETEGLAYREANDEWRAATAPIALRLDQITTETAVLADSFEDRLRALSDELAEAMRPYQEEVEQIGQEIGEVAESFSCALPHRPEGEIGEVDENGWLYASRRGYIEQLGVYRSHHAGGDR